MNTNSIQVDNRRAKDVLCQLKGLYQMLMDSEYKQLDLAQYANQEKYIRVCNGKFRAVSLKDESALGGFSKAGAKKIETIVNHFSNKCPAHLDKSVWLEKEERRVQAWLIKQAFKNSRDLLKPLGIKNTDFDELLFAFDEIPLGSKNNIRKSKIPKPIRFVRCDILAVGRIKDLYYPVQIELKYDRARTRLIEQFNNFICEVKQNEEIQNMFFKLLKTSVGISENVKLQREIIRIIVWPATAGKKTISELTNDGIIIVEYKCNKDDKKHEKGEDCPNYNDIGKWYFAKRSEQL